MEITKRDVAGAVELEVSGRLDAYWADHLGAAIEDSVQAGGHRLRLDMAGVVYMSSVGIRVLLRVRKQLQALGGSFAVVNPSAAVRGVLEMVGLQVLFAEPEARARARAGRVAGSCRVTSSSTSWHAGAARAANVG